MSRKRLGEILVDAGIIDTQQLKHGLYEQRRWGGALGKVLVDQGVVTEEILVRALAKQLNLPVVALSGVTIPRNVLNTITVDLAEEHGIVPFQMQANFLDVAMSDPMNLGIIDELRIRTRLNVRPHLAPATEISAAIRRGYYASHPANAVDVNFDVDILHDTGSEMGGMRDREIAALQRRMAELETLVSRDENVIRKLLSLLIAKGVATREEILEAIK